ncbi:hypothetical protein EDD68_10599 [Melghiribacillus thermohalophilus]|uniref:Uncharacterized protein n=1 Tax=Melghiribacillus thermohalophilus TaxID=1324956 RepID=A0A4R3N764_9BACI|nr:hypothetical protein EDD68_10599 [Melghiribacillus thermohalophilus]
MIDDTYQASFRESFLFQNKPVECFVHNSQSYHVFFDQDRSRARPSLLQMVYEGVIVKDDGFAQKWKDEAEHILIGKKLKNSKKNEAPCTEYVHMIYF